MVEEFILQLDMPHVCFGTLQSSGATGSHSACCGCLLRPGLASLAALQMLLDPDLHHPKPLARLAERADGRLLYLEHIILKFFTQATVWQATHCLPHSQLGHVFGV